MTAPAQLTDAELDAIEQRANAATPPEWGASGDMVTSPSAAETTRRVFAGEVPFTSRRIAITTNDTYLTPEECASNAAFIAHARQDVPRLTAAVRKLQADVARLTAVIETRDAEIRVQSLSGRELLP